MFILELYNAKKNNSNTKSIKIDGGQRASQAARSRNVFFTKRQSRIAYFTCKGFTYEDIGQELHISKSKVYDEVRIMLAKFNI